MDKNTIISAPKCKALKHIRKYVNNDYLDKVDDPYFWLSNKSNPEVIDYLKQENAYTDYIMQDTKDLQKEIFNEIKARVQETDTSAPWPFDNYLYYFRTIKDKEYSIFCRCKNNQNNTIDSNSEEILLDENILAETHDFFHIGDEEISPCHKFLAYTVDTTGDEKHSLYIKDIAKNITYDFSVIADLNHLCAHLTWSADSQSLLYVMLDSSLRPYQVWHLDFAYFRKNSNKPDLNKLTHLLFEETDERFRVSTDISRSKEYIFIEVESHLSSEIYYLPAKDILNNINNLILIKPREQDVQYFIEHQNTKNNQESYLYLLINSKQKPNYELYRINLNNNKIHPNDLRDLNQWELLIKHNDNTKLEDFESFENFCILFTRTNGLNYLHIINNNDFSKIQQYNIEQHLNEQVYTLFPAHNEMYKTQEYRFHYESLSTPDSVYSLTIDESLSDINQIKLNLIKQDEVLSNFDRSHYITERLFVSIDDVDNKIKVPISLIYNKNFYKKDGKHPLLLYGYGSYGISMEPYFSHSRISLLDRGIAFAIAHIRGGGDLGETWHHQGRLDCKTNTFTDFIKSAEYLIENNYTNSHKLIIQGGSAGGLLMGNVINQRPELFHCVIAEVPFVDCLNTMLNPNLPLTVTEYEEWGNPTADSEVYKYIKSYAPYENVTNQCYPHILINNSLEDCRVSYWEAAKWAAKLRVNKTDNNILLLKTEMTAGHSGASGRYQSLHEIAFNYSFIIKTLKNFSK